jgi:predicted ester cyclase
MSALLDRMLGLWDKPFASRNEARAAFATVYAEQMTLNGQPLSLDDLVTRSVNLQSTYADQQREVIHHIEAGDQVIIGFYLTGRQIGPVETPLGVVPPTGKTVRIQVTDILTLRDGRIADIWMMASDLSLLMQLGALTRLADPTARG